jgi:uncharacterized protein YoxC
MIYAWVFIVFLIVAVIVMAFWLSKAMARVDDWESVTVSLSHRIAELETQANELYRKCEKLRKDLDVTAPIVEQTHMFVENVKKTAKDATRASAARIAALQNRNLR